MSGKPPCVLGLHGPAGSGKSTVATLLERDHGFVSIAFADPLKQMLRQLPLLYEWDIAHLHGPLKNLVDPDTGLLPRALFQSLGDWGRAVDPRFWVRNAEVPYRMELANANERGERLAVVFSDVRFPNEAAWVRAQGGRIVHIRCGVSDNVPAHLSELPIAFEEGDLSLDNRWRAGDPQERVTLTELRMRVADIVHQLRGWKMPLTQAATA